METRKAVNTLGDTQILKEDRLYIQSWLDAYFDSPHRDILMSLPAKMNEDDAGVPVEMQDGEVDEEGWVHWRMLDSAVTEEQIDELAEALIRPRSDACGAAFSVPPLYAAYLSTRYVLNVYLRYDGCTIALPNLPSDSPLEEIRKLWSAWPTLIEAGYIPFASYEDGAGPVCWDANKPDQERDYAVVWFDHESLLDEQQYSREKLELHAQTLCSSFRAMLMQSASK
ncbi:hypothetical protein GCM10008014_11190 [Paenibacillus silvae]|uniref:SMI1/KNR4 family protein n=1 Tax=Paenibacillus silvae TaxID=1325358 RepID=A0ABQ1Z2J5_9BACL|nr:hypothetical protein [Paenibacillus silvae]GGH47702.1 hypothetical protein GCM10008014_11190 [Paenibacillus silvae]